MASRAGKTAGAAADVELVLAGERMLLCPERAMVWTARSTVLIADAHFGKTLDFRRAGIGVPSGTTEDDLARLRELLRRHRAERLVVLGDFIHSAAMPQDAFVDALRAFRREHAQLEMTVLRGNHDKRIAALSDFHWHRGALVEPPFRFIHDLNEAEPAPALHTLSGHIHPCRRIRLPAGTLRAPVFWVRPTNTVLPAFGQFTGGYTVNPGTNDRCFAAMDRVVALD
jgi:DNA ligase-associated metallophosphoesterase